MAVELQLGLALPTVLIGNPIAVKGLLFDLNRSSAYSDDDESDASTEFSGSQISIRSCGDRSGSRSAIAKKKIKRSFEESSESDCASTDTPPTLPLLLWNKKPKDDDDLPNFNRTCNLNLIKNGEETEGIVGWPPIKSYWKKQRGQEPAAARNGGGRGGGGARLYHYVKVQIEGVLITRKIDLNLHQSFETLTSAILFMFGRGHENAEEYNLTCQDKEGDWLLAANMPWRTLVESVQRLKLMRKEE
ncbi:hypothetical protein V2J09_010327 [Rumex salicifolius]